MGATAAVAANAVCSLGMRRPWTRHHHHTADIDRLGRDLGEIIDRLCTGPVIVVGHSLGGMAVMALADQRPELFGSKILGVALLSTSAGELASSLPRPAARLLQTPHFARAML